MLQNKELIMRLLGSLCLIAVLAGCSSTAPEKSQLAANNSDAAGETSPKLHCVSEKKRGSNFKTKVCMTREQLEESRRISSDNLRDHAQKQGRLSNTDGI
jgi:hypothetical protein